MSKLNIDKTLSVLNKYYLGGTCDKAYVSSGNTILSTEKDTWSIRVFINSKDNIFNIEEPFVIVDTKQFIQLLKLFNTEEVDFELIEDKIVINDSETSVEINIGDVEVLNPEYKRFPKQDKLPKEYPIELEITNEFIDKFLKARGALKDERLVHFKLRRKKPYLVVGNEKDKTDLVNIELSKYGKFEELESEDKSVSFLGSYLQNVFVANRNSKIVLKADHRLMLITATDEKLGIDVTYFIGSN